MSTACAGGVKKSRMLAHARAAVQCLLPVPRGRAAGEEASCADLRWASAAGAAALAAPTAGYSPERAAAAATVAQAESQSAVDGALGGFAQAHAAEVRRAPSESSVLLLAHLLAGV